MPCELMNLVIAFAPLFSKPAFNHVKDLLTGDILSPPSRTVTKCFAPAAIESGETFSELSPGFESGFVELFEGGSDFAESLDQGFSIKR